MSTGPRSFNESELNHYGRAPAFAALWDAFPVSTVPPGITWVKFGLEDAAREGSPPVQSSRSSSRIVRPRRRSGQSVSPLPRTSLDPRAEKRRPDGCWFSCQHHRSSASMAPPTVPRHAHMLAILTHQRDAVDVPSLLNLELPDRYPRGNLVSCRSGDRRRCRAPRRSEARQTGEAAGAVKAARARAAAAAQEDSGMDGRPYSESSDDVRQRQ